MDYSDESRGIAEFLGARSGQSLHSYSHEAPAESCGILIDHEGNAFAFPGNVEEDILSITTVHPMREEAVRELLRKAHADWSVVEELLRRSLLIELDYNGKKF
ncbi:hypothetical protein [Thermococcus onnurineus]|uniref:hypothetical protein n=1 Tax=Thermococcus onnurineus TaxID=342948 RepID=UPI000324D28D